LVDINLKTTSTTGPTEGKPGGCACWCFLEGYWIQGVVFTPLSWVSRSHMSSLWYRKMLVAVLALPYITEVVLHSWCVY
jgi:hypothetical protein